MANVVFEFKILKLTAKGLRNVKKRSGDKNDNYLTISFGDITFTTSVQKASGSDATWKLIDGDFTFQTNWPEMKLQPLKVTAMDSNTFTPHKLIGFAETLLINAANFLKLPRGSTETEITISMSLHDENGEESGNIEIDTNVKFSEPLSRTSFSHSSFLEGLMAPEPEQSTALDMGGLSNVRTRSPIVERSPRRDGHDMAQAAVSSAPLQCSLAASVEISIGGLNITSLFVNLQNQIDELKRRPFGTGSPSSSSASAPIESFDTLAMKRFEVRVMDLMKQSHDETMSEMELRLEEMLARARNNDPEEQALQQRIRNLTKRVQDLEEATGEGAVIALDAKFSHRIESLEKRMSAMEQLLAGGSLLGEGTHSTEFDGNLGGIKEQLDRMRSLEESVMKITSEWPDVQRQILTINDRLDEKDKQVHDLLVESSKLSDSYSVHDGRITELYQQLSKLTTDTARIKWDMSLLPEECLSKVSQELSTFEQSKANRVDLERKADHSLVDSKANVTEIHKLFDMTNQLARRVNTSANEMKEDMELLTQNTDKKLEALGMWVMKALRRTATETNNGPANGTDIGKVRCLVCDQTSWQDPQADVVHGGPPMNLTLRPFKRSKSPTTLATSPGDGAGFNSKSRTTNEPPDGQPSMPTRSRSIRSTSPKSKVAPIVQSNVTIPAGIAAILDGTAPPAASTASWSVPVLFAPSAGGNDAVIADKDYIEPEYDTGLNRNKVHIISAPIASPDEIVGSPMLELDDGAEYVRDYLPPAGKNGRPTVFELVASNTERQRKMTEMQHKEIETRYRVGATRPSNTSGSSSSAMRPSSAPAHRPIAGGKLQSLGRPVSGNDRLN